MKDPALLFYTSDFLTGVVDLTMEERGQYITMLCLQHQKGHLSEKTIRLSVGLISDDVRNKFSLDNDGNLYNEVLEKHIQERLKFTESRRNNGLKGGRPKKEEKPLGYASANLVEDVNEDNKLKEIFNKYCEHLRSISIYERLARNGGIKPTEIMYCINEFIDTRYASIIEKKNKYDVEEYFLNWIKKDGRVLECINNQHRKNGKAK